MKHPNNKTAEESSFARTWEECCNSPEARLLHAKDRIAELEVALKQIQAKIDACRPYAKNTAILCGLILHIEGVVERCLKE